MIQMSLSPVAESVKKETPSQKTYTSQELEAIYQEGRRYYYDSPANFTKAIEYFTIAAERGHAEAQYMLEICYRNGWGLSEDIEKARYWFQQAINQGYTLARQALDDLNKRGK